MLLDHSDALLLHKKIAALPSSLPVSKYRDSGSPNKNTTPCYGIIRRSKTGFVIKSHGSHIVSEWMQKWNQMLKFVPY